VGPDPAATFLSQSFGQAPHRGRLALEDARALFGWNALNRALAEHRLAPPRLRLEKAGSDISKVAFKTRRTRRGAVLQDLDAAALNSGLRDGATLILDAANELSPDLRSLCSQLAAEFACSCQANLYACWGTTQGFDVHWDDHDVFVVQVEGRKRWVLYGSTREAPTRKDLHGEHLRPTEAQDEFALEPGDLLYLPRGHWHAAVGLGEPSLHLTIGLTRKTGADFLHWMADHLLQEAIVRRDLPLEGDDRGLGAHLAQVLTEITRRDASELGRLYRRHVQAAQPQRPQLSFPFIGEALPPDTRLRLADGAARLSEGPRPGQLVLSWRGTEFTLDASLRVPLERLVAHEAVRLSDFEDAAPHERSEATALVQELFRRGALFVPDAAA
jgi:ribosomal protein L16 Arg81 hydroxylase